MSETWNKKERERKKQQKRKAKLEKRLEKKQVDKGAHSLESMLAYVDENGNLSSQPMDPRKKLVVNVENIDISIPRQRDVPSEDQVQVGIVTLFKTDRGFGFIKNPQTQQSYFFHIKSLIDPVKENNRVSFETEKGPRGPSAINIRLSRA